LHRVEPPEGRQYHIACKPGDLAKYLLIPGDPERVPKIAKHWDFAREVAYHREFRVYTGIYEGVPISAVSSGIGPACMSIVVNEARCVGAETFIRVGSCGAIQDYIECGDLVILTAAVRMDGTSECYVPVEYPAVADYEVVLALIEACEELGYRYHVGIGCTTCDFYAGQQRLKSMRTQNLIETMRKANILIFEMEAATLFTLANLYNLRSGAICTVYANRIKDEFKPGAGEEKCIKAANNAVKILNEWDIKKNKAKKKRLYPTILK